MPPSLVVCFTSSAAIATVQKELNTAAGALVTVVRASASGAGDVHQAVNALYAELDGYAKQASTIEDPINRVRDHLSSLHTIDHYLRVADSILDPLSWIARKYVCKNDDTFSGVHAALKEAGSWGSSAVSGWLEAGVRAAIDALGDAELHLQQTTTALKAVNNSLEGTGIAQARRATDAITAAICKLDGQLALQQANTGTDWLSQALQTQLDNLAGEIIGAGAH